MQCKIKSLVKREWLSFFLVAWLVVCSGSQHFRIYNSFFTNMLLLVMALFCLFKWKKITKNNCIRIVVIGVFVGYSVFVGVYINHFQLKLNDAMIFFITCNVLVILQSTMSAADFKNKYVYFMTAETLLSLVCFILVVFLEFDKLPGYYERIVHYSEQGYNIVYLTPYYTLGWLSTHGYFRRNAGMFWEPGAHAVYLNLAILFIFGGALDGIKPKIRYTVLGILMLGSLSTMSTTGYLTLAVSIAFFIFQGPKKQNTRKKMIIAIIVTVAVLYVALFGSVFDKLIYRSGSFGTRFNDTIVGLSVACQNWFMGKGIFVDITDTLNDVGIVNMSNGMVGLLIRIGFPMMIIYVKALCKGIKQLFQVSGIALFCAELFFLLSMCSESLCTYPIFISLLFFWRNNHKKVEFTYETLINKCTRKSLYIKEKA